MEFYMKLFCTAQKKRVFDRWVTPQIDWADF
jgi:hypothetical protein